MGVGPKKPEKAIVHPPIDEALYAQFNAMLPRIRMVFDWYAGDFPSAQAPPFQAYKRCVRDFHRNQDQPRQAEPESEPSTPPVDCMNEQPRNNNNKTS